MTGTSLLHLEGEGEGEIQKSAMARPIPQRLRGLSVAVSLSSRVSHESLAVLQRELSMDQSKTRRYSNVDTALAQQRPIVYVGVLASVHI